MISDLITCGLLPPIRKREESTVDGGKKKKRDRRTEINVFSNIANHYEPTARILLAGTPRNPLPSRRRWRIQSKGAGNRWRNGFTNTRAAGGGIKDVWRRGDLVNTLNAHLSLSLISLLSRADFLTSLGARVSRPKSPVKTVFLYSKFWLIFSKFCFFPHFHLPELQSFHTGFRAQAAFSFPITSC